MFAIPISNQTLKMRRNAEAKRKAFAELDLLGWQSPIQWYSPNGVVERYCPKGSGYGTPTQYYVDYGGGSDMTGDGSIITPWQTVQHALDNITRDTTNGDQINLKSNSAHILSALLSVATYGTSTINGAPLIFRGYDSLADDGGIATLSGNSGNFAVGALSSSLGATAFIDLEITDSGTADLCVSATNRAHINCEIHDGDGKGVSGNRSGLIVNCNIHDVGDNGAHNVGMVYGCYFKNDGTRTMPRCVSMSETNINTIRNIMSIDSTTVGIQIYGNNYVQIFNNSILSNAGTGKGITSTSITGASIFNNIIEGFSGAGGCGYDLGGSTSVPQQVARNAAYNNTTNYDLGDVIYSYDNEVLAGSAFVKSGSDTYANRHTYFEPQDVGNIFGGTIFNGDKGAVARQPSVGGGTNIIIRPRRTL